jgi:hypothetical protein
MRHFRTAVLIPIFTCAVAVNQAHALQIEFAGDECGSPDLLGLTLVVGGPFGQTIEGCESSFGPGGFGAVSDGTTPFYGEFIESIELEIGGLTPADVVTAGDSSSNALDLIEDLGDGRFRLFTDGPGLDVCSLDGCIGDAVLSFAELPDDREFMIKVVAVNDQAIPEPATVAVTALGLAATAFRRRRRLGVGR